MCTYPRQYNTFFHICTHSYFRRNRQTLGRRELRVEWKKAFAYLLRYSQWVSLLPPSPERMCIGCQNDFLNELLNLLSMDYKLRSRLRVIQTIIWKILDLTMPALSFFLQFLWLHHDNFFQCVCLFHDQVHE